MVTELELQRRWAERVASGQFSPAVQGVGTIRVMGKSGDAPVAFPRVASLDLLPGLAEDEQWAVRQAEAIVAEAQQNGRTVFDSSAGSPAGSRRLSVFEPSAETLMVVARIAGG